MSALWLVAISMFFRDALATSLTVAEAKGSVTLAGPLDALGDLASVVCTVYGAGVVITNGWTWFSVEVLAVMMATSLVGTTFWTWLSRRIPDPREARIVHLESWATGLGYSVAVVPAPLRRGGAGMQSTSASATTPEKGSL